MNNIWKFVKLKSQKERGKKIQSNQEVKLIIKRNQDTQIECEVKTKFL